MQFEEHLCEKPPNPVVSFFGVLYITVYRSVLFPRNLACPTKFLVACLGHTCVQLKTRLITETVVIRDIKIKISASTFVAMSFESLNISVARMWKLGVGKFIYYSFISNFDNFS